MTRFRDHNWQESFTSSQVNRADLQAPGSSQAPEQLLEQQLCHQFPFRGVQPGDGSAAHLGAELLAWLVYQGHFEIRVGLPVHDGQISTDGAIFHDKEGVVRDSTGDGLAFTGSINKTPKGWTTNYETFDVFCTWKGEERRVDAKAAIPPSTESLPEPFLWRRQCHRPRLYTGPSLLSGSPPRACWSAGA